MRSQITTKPNCLRSLFAALCFVLLSSTLLAQSTGTVTGQVRNAATGYFLEGAVVEVAGTGRQAITDREGRYMLDRLPGGAANLVVRYTGLDTQSFQVDVGAGATVVRDIGMTAAIYKMDAFTVEGEREGSASALSRQQRADNVKNVVATDALGTQTEDNVGYFLAKLPGIVATDVSGSGVRQVMVRGIDASLNTVEMDGVQLANNNSTGTNRAFDFFQASLSLVESIEVTKAPLPDAPANSIGGSINMVTRSAFNRNNPRAIRYTIGLSHALNRRGGRAEHWTDEPIKRLTPNITFGYSDVIGKKRNLGISLTYARNSVFYSSTDTNHFYQGTLEQPAYLYRTSLQLQAMGGPHVRQNLGAKLEFKQSERTTFTFGATHNFYIERPYTLNFNLQTAQNTARFAPGYTEARSQVLPHTSSAANIANNAWDNVSHNYRFQGTGKHSLPGLLIDYSGTLSFSQAFQNRSPFERQYNHGVRTKGSVAISGLNNIGWIVDRTRDPVYPTITQTAGRDMYDLGNYSSMVLTQDNRIAKAGIAEGRLNVKKDFDVGVPAYIKTGLLVQEQRREKDYRYHRYTYTGGSLAQFAENSSWASRTLEGMRQGPWADIYRVARHKEDNPNQWTEDYYYKYSQRLIHSQEFRETISSAYVMGHVKVQQLSVSGGLRVENTETLGIGPLFRLTPEERARRAAWTGPVTEAEAERRAYAERGERTRGEGEYRNVFPGLHLRHSHPSGLVTRLSYSTSIGRAPIGQIIPSTNVNDDNMTLSISNPSLRPQYSDNFDLSVERYFEPIGLLSASVFLKEVSGFIYADNSRYVAAGPNNGFDGLYEGYRISTRLNGGRARYRGFELNYQQRFTFLPGFLSGFGINANYTQLETKGDYGGTVATTKVPGFRPKSANGAVSYQRGRYSVSVQTSWVDAYLASVSTNAALIQYQAPRTSTSLKLTFNWTNRTTFYFNWDNVTNEPLSSLYYARPERVGYTRLANSSIAFGLQGRF